MNLGSPRRKRYSRSTSGTRRVDAKPNIVLRGIVVKILLIFTKKTACTINLHQVLSMAMLYCLAYLY